VKIKIFKSLTSISAIINLHREGELAKASILSAVTAVDKAEEMMNISTRIIIVLDAADPLTISAAGQYVSNNKFKIYNVNLKDLSCSRNFAIDKCDTEYVAFLDGDDLWGEDWLWKAIQNDQRLNIERDVIWHPEINFIFENDNHIFFHTDMDSHDFFIDYLRVSNYWTALSLAKTRIYQEIPFIKNEIKFGMGFEDWNWNCRTIEKGFKHKVAINTCHFIRNKKIGSLLSKTNKNHCVLTPHNLFSPNTD